MIPTNHRFSQSQSQVFTNVIPTNHGFSQSQVFTITITGFHKCDSNQSQVFTFTIAITGFHKCDSAHSPILTTTVFIVMGITHHNDQSIIRITWPDATVQDLAYALRDGVLLCHTLHIIDPSTLDMKQVLNIHFCVLYYLHLMFSL